MTLCWPAFAREGGLRLSQTQSHQSLHRAVELAVGLVEQMKLAIVNREIGAVQLQPAIAFPFADAGKCAQICEADLDGGMFHVPQGIGALPRHHRVTRVIKQVDPA